MAEWEATYLNNPLLDGFSETLYCDTIEMLIRNLSEWDSHEVVVVSDNELLAVANFGDKITRKLRRKDEPLV